MKKIVLFILTLSFYLANAQDKNNRMEKIDTVRVNAIIKKYPTYQQSIRRITITLANADMGTLSNKLRVANGIFFKEYGRGMLSTISLRGTDASHTQVVWNGIPVNSVLNGQVDMNTIYMGGYNYISLQKGGNSAEFGSGAIGGTIRLQDVKPYHNGIFIIHQLQAGSFNTFRNNTTIVYQNKKFYTNISFQSNKSDNDYPFVGYDDIKNDNGAYFGKDLNLILGYKFNKKNEIYYKSQVNWLDRKMSRSLYRPDNAKLITNNQRYLLGWKYKSGKIQMRTDLANIYEKYQYFFDKNNDDSNDSRSNVWHLINTIDYKISKNASFKLGNSLHFVEATGDAIAQHTRKQYAIYGIWKQKIKKISYQLKLRKEFTNDYKIPLIAGAVIQYKPKENWITRANISTNYRVPTFNDLYWNPGGNPDLKPENSLSFDISQSMIFNNKGSFFDRTSIYLSAFYIRSHNLIKWQPVNNNIWQPINIAETSSKGIEIGVSQSFNIVYKLESEIFVGYTYQNVKDELTHKKLPYLPAQMFHGILKMKYSKFMMRYQADFNDKIYTTSSNTQFMDSSLIHNTSLQYKLNDQLSFEGKIDNIFNTFYQTMPSRPQPGRNYSININFKIHQYNEKN